MSTNENEEERRADAKEGRRRQCEQGRRERGRLTCPFLAEVRRCAHSVPLRGAAPRDQARGAHSWGTTKRRGEEEEGEE